MKLKPEEIDFWKTCVLMTLGSGSYRGTNGPPMGDVLSRADYAVAGLRERIEAEGKRRRAEQRLDLP